MEEELFIHKWKAKFKKRWNMKIGWIMVITWVLYSQSGKWNKSAEKWENGDRGQYQRGRKDFKRWTHDCRGKKGQNRPNKDEHRKEVCVLCFYKSLKIFWPSQMICLLRKGVNIKVDRNLYKFLEENGLLLKTMWLILII